MGFKEKYGFAIGVAILGAVILIYALTSGSVISNRLAIGGLILIGVSGALAWQSHDM